MRYGNDFTLQDDEDSSKKTELDESSLAAGEACWEE